MSVNSCIRWGVIALMLGLIIAASAAYAQPHDTTDPNHWYPMNCCSRRDCAPVDKIVQTPQGRLVTSKHGTVLVPVNYDKVQQSQDAKFHVCMRPDYDEYSTTGEMHLLCFFEPNGS